MAVVHLAMALCRTPVCAMRLKAVNAFSTYLDYADALDLENICYDISILNNSPYTRPVFRALFSLDQSIHFAPQIRTKGASNAMSFPDTAYFGTDPKIVEEQTQSQEIELYKTLITDLTKNDIELGAEGGVKCMKCTSTDITFSFLQVRSADEGISVTATCDACGKRWRLS